MGFASSLFSLASALLALQGAECSRALRGDYLLTPAGPIHKSCVHKVESGSNIYHDQQEGILYSNDVPLPKCQYPYGRVPQTLAQRRLLQFPADYDGWLSYTVSNSSLAESSKSVDSFTGYFSVPDEPASFPDILYIFTGLQNVDWIPKVDPEPLTFDIIQPVLQYPSDTGTGWSVKSWYVTLDSGAIQSKEIIVSAGDLIFGNMTQSASTPTQWYVGSTLKSNQKTTAITVNKARLNLQPWAYNTIECYGCTDCSSLPTVPCEFTELSLTSGGRSLAANWLDTPKPPTGSKKCNERSSILSDSTVTFSFQ